MQPPPVPLNVQQLAPYVPGKPVEDVQRELGLTDVIKLASNENPLGPSSAAIAAMCAAARRVGEYPDAASHALVQTLVEHLGVPQDHLVIGNGSDELIHYLGVAFLRPGDEVLSAEPTFVRYRAAATLNEADYVAVPTREGCYDLEAMSQRLSERTRLVFIANPNNPTGTIVRRRQLEQFLDRVPAQCVVVLDEAYYEYVDDDSYPNGIDYVLDGINVIALRTFSKVYALAGLRVGYGISRPEIAAALHRVREPFNVNRIAQAAAIASLGDREHLAASRAANKQGIRFLEGALRELGLASLPTQANFVAIDLQRDSADIVSDLMRRGVIVRAGEALGLPGHIRVTIGTPEQNRRFIRDLAAVLEARSDEARTSTRDSAEPARRVG